MSNIYDEIFNRYYKKLSNEVKNKINQLNSNLYGIGTEDEDFNFSKYADDVMNEIDQFNESYFNNFFGVWYDNINQVESDIECDEDWNEIYHIDKKTIKESLLGQELANTI